MYCCSLRFSGQLAHSVVRLAALPSTLLADFLIVINVILKNNWSDQKDVVYKLFLKEDDKAR